MSLIHININNYRPLSSSSSTSRRSNSNLPLDSIYILPRGVKLNVACRPAVISEVFHYLELRTADRHQVSPYGCWTLTKDGSECASSDWRIYCSVLTTHPAISKQRIWSASQGECAGRIWLTLWQQLTDYRRLIIVKILIIRTWLRPITATGVSNHRATYLVFPFRESQGLNPAKFHAEITGPLLIIIIIQQSPSHSLPQTILSDLVHLSLRWITQQ
jgi:hypothetical protein